MSFIGEVVVSKDLYYPLVADKNSYNSSNFGARGLKLCIVVDMDITHMSRMAMMTKMMMNMMIIIMRVCDESSWALKINTFYAILYSSRILTQGGAPQTFSFLNKLS